MSVKLRLCYMFSGASLGGLIRSNCRFCRHGDRLISLTTLHTAIDINSWAGKGFEANIDYFMKRSSSRTADRQYVGDVPASVLGQPPGSVVSIAYTDAGHPELSDAERELFLQEISVGLSASGSACGPTMGRRHGVKMPRDQRLGG